jgi:hypothetical protein
MSTDSCLSHASSGASSVTWVGEGLETIRERRGRERAAGAGATAEEKEIKQTGTPQKTANVQWKARNLACWLLCFQTRGGAEGGGWGSGEERGGGGRMGGFPIMAIEEATVDAHGCVGGDEDDKMIIDEEEYGLKTTLFLAWRNGMCCLYCID